MFWKMSSIGWDIKLITRGLLNSLIEKGTKIWNVPFLDNTKFDWCEENNICVRDWSVSSNPIIFWDVNYTVFSLHVKRQIIEEGKRCATLYLVFHFEFIRDSSLGFCVCMMSLLAVVILLSMLYCQILQSILWPVCWCVIPPGICSVHIHWHIFLQWFWCNDLNILKVLHLSNAANF